MKKKKSKPSPEPKPFWDEQIIPPPKERHPLRTFILGLLIAAAFGGGYVTGRPRVIHITKTDRTKDLTLKALPGEACSVVTSSLEWRIVCGIK